jgi:hypothetical protein
LKRLFNHLDNRKTGSVAVVNFVEPLLSMGVIHSRAQFLEIVKARFPLNPDYIEFHDFLRLILTTSKLKAFLRTFQD